MMDVVVEDVVTVMVSIMVVTQFGVSGGSGGGGEGGSGGCNRARPLNLAGASLANPPDRARAWGY